MAVEAVVTLMVNKLDKLLDKEAKLLGVKGEIELIREELNKMRPFLKDADIKQKEDEAVRDWMKNIRYICFDVDDVIDAVIFSQAAPERHGFLERLKRRISDQITRYKVGKEIERIELKIKGISERRVKHENWNINEERQEATSPTQRLQEGSECSVPPKELAVAGSKVDGQLIEEERTRDIEKGKGIQEASSLSRDLQADRWVSTLSGEPEEEINKVGQKLIKEKPRPYDGTRDINEGKQEASSSSQSLQDLRRISALLEESEVVGKQEEIFLVKERLINGEPRRCVISIVGMGGSGKTLLAKKVFEDVKMHFSNHVFVHLSQPYGINHVLMHIIEHVMSPPPKERKKLNVEKLVMMLHGHLRARRYLVVIDDIWSKEAWDMLKFILPEGMNGSRVLLTTRNKDVALHADPSSPPHEMRLLSNEEGWVLLLISLGQNPSTGCPLELEETGKKIVEKCGGLPLAILAVGGLLATREKTFGAWSKVLDNVIWHLTNSSKWCIETLALSYWHLPDYVKPCFLYLGLFPEDYEISSGRLVRLWIAEGFIRQIDGKIMEDVAEDYLEELVSRSMIQVATRKSNGSIRTFRIHRLLRCLSILEARQKNFFTIYNDNHTSSSSTSVKRLAFHCDIDGYEATKSSTATLHSTLCFSNSEVLLSKLLNTGNKLLRVLEVNDQARSKVTLPKQVRGFVHLRYLKIGYNSTYSFPSSIGKLSNLQTLHVKGNGTLSKAVFNLEQLRHLNAYQYSIDGHPQLNNLRNLQTLCLKAGSWIKDGLGKLANLRKLGIHGDLSSYHEILPYSIEKLCNLRSLKLEDGKSIPPFMPFTHHLHLYKMHLDGRIEKLPELPPNLAELDLIDSQLKEDAISTLEKLQHLRILQLQYRSYLSTEMICSSGGFPRLESLTLAQLPLEEWILKEEAMPSLKFVLLRGMPNFETQSLPEQVRAVLSRA